MALGAKVMPPTTALPVMPRADAGQNERVGGGQYNVITIKIWFAGLVSKWAAVIARGAEEKSASDQA